jgi:hypothetical protein
MGEPNGARPADNVGRVVPIWMQIGAALLTLAFLALSVDAYFGPGLRTRVLAASSVGQSEALVVPPRVLYAPGAFVTVGQKGVGSEGQDRTIQEGDTVLLGGTGQVVRVGAGGRTTVITGANGTTTLVANLGAWDGDADRLAGVQARFQGDRWVLNDPGLLANGPDLHPQGAPSEALTSGFSVVPDPDTARVRRVGDQARPAIRIRARRKAATMMLDTREPIQTLDGVLVTVSAVVRGQSGGTMVLALEDVTDADRTVQAATDRRPVSEEWTKLTVRKRILYPSSNDKVLVGLVDVDGDDWFEVREFKIVAGVSP